MNILWISQKAKNNNMSEVITLRNFVFTMQSYEVTSLLKHEQFCMKQTQHSHYFFILFLEIFLISGLNLPISIRN